MPYIFPTAFPQPPKSETCVQVNLSFSTAFNQASFLLSKDTPKIVKPLSLKSLYAFTTFCFSTIKIKEKLANYNVHALSNIYVIFFL